MKKTAIAAIIVVTALAAVAVWRYSRTGTDGNGMVRISGTIEATTVDVSFKVPGRVLERLVDEGENVRAGQVVARLDGADLAQEVSMRKAAAEHARAGLRELEAGSRKEEIARAAAVLAAAEAESVRLTDDFRRQQELFRREVVPKQKFDAALAARDAAQARERESMESLALIRKGPREERVDQGRASLKEAEASLALASERFGYATLTSPVAGLVMAKNIEPGEQVAVGTPVVTIGLLDNVWVRAYIAETDLGRVKVGQKVRVTTDTWPGRIYDGTVSFISSEAEFTPKNVQTSRERVKLVYRLKITLSNPNRELKPGMPADAEILAK
jgi:membrane fusion protein YbhG